MLTDRRPPRTMGIEEEFLLVDLDTGSTRPEAPQVLRGCRERLDAWESRQPDAASRPEAKQEFFMEQVELATRPCRTVEELSGQIHQGRAALIEAAAEVGVAPVAMALPVLPGDQGSLTPTERFTRIHEIYGGVATLSLMCSLHVHVQISDQAEAIGILDRLRPWLPVILAMSANSPYHHGVITGYDSWRSRLWEMWPSSGPPEHFDDETTFRTTTDRLVAWGAADDHALLNFAARPSVRFPTVEIRVADTCAASSDSLLLATVIRALVETCARDWKAGAPLPLWRSDELRAAHWRAARYGLRGQLVDPLELRLVPAGEALTHLAHQIAPVLRDAEDEAFVHAGLLRLRADGNGADLQRKVYESTGDFSTVVADLRRRTAQAP